MTRPVTSKNFIQPAQEKVKDNTMLKVIAVGLVLTLLIGAAWWYIGSRKHTKPQKDICDVFDAIGKHDIVQLKECLNSPSFKPTACDQKGSSLFTAALDNYYNSKGTASSNDALEIVTILCSDRRIDINEDHYLHRACQKMPELVDVMLKRDDVKVNEPNAGQQTPLWIAILNENTDLIPKLQSRGADLEYKYDSQTPLEFAVEKSLSKTVDALRKCGAKETYKTLERVILSKNIALLESLQVGELTEYEKRSIWHEALGDQSILTRLHQLSIIPKDPIGIALQNLWSVETLEFLLKDLQLVESGDIHSYISRSLRRGLSVSHMQTLIDHFTQEQLANLGKDVDLIAFYLKHAEKNLDLGWSCIEVCLRGFPDKTKKQADISNAFCELFNPIFSIFKTMHTKRYNLALKLLGTGYVTSYPYSVLEDLVSGGQVAVLKKLDETNVPLESSQNENSLRLRAIDKAYKKIVGTQNPESIYEAIFYLNTKIPESHDDNIWQWVCRNGQFKIGNNMFRQDYPLDDAISDDELTLLQLAEAASTSNAEAEKNSFIKQLKQATTQPDRTGMPRSNGTSDVRSNVLHSNG